MENVIYIHTEKERTKTDDWTQSRVITYELKINQYKEMLEINNHAQAEEAAITIGEQKWTGQGKGSTDILQWTTAGG